MTNDPPDELPGHRLRRHPNRSMDDKAPQSEKSKDNLCDFPTKVVDIGPRDRYAQNAQDPVRLRAHASLASALQAAGFLRLSRTITSK